MIVMEVIRLWWQEWAGLRPGRSPLRLDSEHIEVCRILCFSVWAIKCMYMSTSVVAVRGCQYTATDTVARASPWPWAAQVRSQKPLRAYTDSLSNLIRLRFFTAKDIFVCLSDQICREHLLPFLSRQRTDHSFDGGLTYRRCRAVGWTMLTFLCHFISIFQHGEEEDEEVELSCNGLDTIAGCNHIHAFAGKWNLPQRRSRRLVLFLIN